MDRPPPVSLFSRLRGNSHKRSTSSGRHGGNNGYESDADHKQTGRQRNEWQKETRRGRSSLSALDQKREEAMRRDIEAFLDLNPARHGLKGPPSGNKTRTGSSPSTSTKVLQREEDYLAAFGRSPFRRPAHQRHASASASFAPRSHADVSLLRPPSRFPPRVSAPSSSPPLGFPNTSTALSSNPVTQSRTRVAAAPVPAAPRPPPALSSAPRPHQQPPHAAVRPSLATDALAKGGNNSPGSHSNYTKSSNPTALLDSDLIRLHERGRAHQSLEDFIWRTDRANAKAMHSNGPSPGPPAAPVGVGGGFSLFTPSDATIMNEGLPESSRANMYNNRPRRLSGSSNASSSFESTSNSTPRESFESRMRSSSWGSQTSFESFYSAHSSQHQHHRASFASYAQFPWQRPAPIKPVRRKSKPGELFSILPGEVLEMILAHLKKLHLAPGSTSCATCWMRDACSAALSCRKMLRHAHGALYEDVQLVGADSAQHRKKYKNAAGTRMILLRRTLRGNPRLAMLVKTLKVPAMPQSIPDPTEYLDTVASLIMACPNLERVVGFYPRYDHTFSRYFHALSTRQRLKDMNWVVEPTQFQLQHRVRGSSGSLTKMMQPSKSSQTQLQALAKRQTQAPSTLQPQQVASFLELHSNWHFLTTLVVHCQPGATLMPASMVIKSVAYLPALQDLHLSHLPQTAFDDNSLLYLPTLKKLTLVQLPGVTAAGLSAFASRGTSARLETLTIIHCRLNCLRGLARILANLTSLTSFSLVQSNPPSLPEGEVIWLFPYVASPTLRHLHWDVPASATRGTTTDSILAQSIEAGGFPGLRRLRVPNDPEGWFQKLCRPQEKADLPGDRYRGGQNHLSSHSRASSYNSNSGHSPPGSGDAANDEKKSRVQFSDLHQARLAAQARIESSRRVPRFFVNVVDEDGLLVEKYGIAAFVGSVESRISYHLFPDPGATDERGGLVGMAELLGDGGENLVGGTTYEESSKREGCAGRWNAYSSVSSDKKDKDRYIHTERGRWRGVVLS